jgi:hypothetical protein
LLTIELAFQNEEKKNVQQSYLFARKSELYLDMAGSALYLWIKRVISLSKSEVFGNLGMIK